MSERSGSGVPNRLPVTFKHLVVPIPGADRVTVRAPIPFATRDGVAIDLYDPPARRTHLPGAVILVNGLPDPGARRILGCAVNEMASFISWARAIAASGTTAVTYTTTSNPSEDLLHVAAFLHAQGARLGIDATRLGLWACSSHVPNAIGLLLAMPAVIQRAVCCYGFMLDLDEATDVADAQRTWHFANPAHGRRVEELPATPLFVVRAGRDTTTGVNASIDAFVRHALAANLPLTLVNQHMGAHAFDLDDDSATTRAVVGQILSFLSADTTPAPDRRG